MADVPEDMASNQKPDVFLCHSSQDKPIVRRLGTRLAANKVSSWIDECNLDGGCDWQEEILNSLVNAKAVVVCFGPSGCGRWQKHEIAIMVQKRIEAGKEVIPVVLPTCTEDPAISLWLSTAQIIDLRRDEIEADPFGRLLKSIDGRDSIGHYRPSVLLLCNKSEPTSNDAHEKAVSECANSLQRVRVLDYSQPLLKEELEKGLKHADVLVSLLAPDSYDTLPGGAFRDGIAAGAKHLAVVQQKDVIQWRAEGMKLPADSALEKQFRVTDTETCLPTQLAKYATEKAETTFAQRQIHTEALNAAIGKRRALLGYPLNGKRFVRQVTEDMEQREIECSSPPKWELLLNLLRQDPELYEAVVVVLTGDDEWLCDCTDALRKLQSLDRALPRVRAFLHKADDKYDADPIPIRLAEFEEFFGLQDVSRLAKKIVTARGPAS